MAQLIFPPNPTNNQSFKGDNGVTYVYKSPPGVWTAPDQGAGPGSDWKELIPTGLPSTGFGSLQLLYGNGVWLLFTGSATSTYYTSTDNGNTWTARNWPLGGGNTFARCTFGGGKFVGFATNQGSVPAYQSTDGISWTSAGQVVGSQSQTTWTGGAITYGQGYYWATVGTINQFAGEIGSAIYRSATLSGNWDYVSIQLSFTSGGSTQYRFIRPTCLAVNSLSLCSSGTYYIDNNFYQIANAGDLTTSPTSPPAIVGSGTAVTSGNYGSSFCIAGENNIIAFLGNGNSITTAKAFVNIRGTVSNVSPNSGFNQVYTGFYNPTAKALCAAGTGGLIAYSYNDGVTWIPSYKQYEVAGVGNTTFTGAASSPTVGMVVGAGAGGNAVLLRSTF